MTRARPTLYVCPFAALLTVKFTLTLSPGCHDAGTVPTSLSWSWPLPPNEIGSTDDSVVKVAGRSPAAWTTSVRSMSNGWPATTLTDASGSGPEPVLLAVARAPEKPAEGWDPDTRPDKILSGWDAGWPGTNEVTDAREDPSLDETTPEEPTKG